MFNFRKFFKGLTIAVGCLGIAATATFGATLAVNSSTLFTDEERTYSCEFYVDDVLVYSEVLKRGEPITYGLTLDTMPSKKSDADGTYYIFSGWDYNNDGIADVPIAKAYMNFKAKALFTKYTLPEIDWSKIDMYKLLQLLMDLNIDLEAFMNFFGLTWEDIQNLIKDPVMSFTIKGNYDAGLVYLRTNSFGDYDSLISRWNDADYYPLSNISQNSINPLLYAGNKINQIYPALEYEINYIKGGNIFPVPSYEVENKQNLASDSYSLTNPVDKKYTTMGIGFMPATAYTITAANTLQYTNQAIKNDELKYREYARSHYLKIDQKYQTYFSSLSEQLGINGANIGAAVDKIYEYMGENYNFELMMNSYPKNEDNILYFMQTAHEGTGRQFASAATMWMRSLGVPARYTQGYVSYSNGNEEVIVNSLQAHSWCEIYVDGAGWLTLDAVISKNLGALIGASINPYFNTDDDVDLDQFESDRKLDYVEVNTDEGKTKFDYFVGEQVTTSDIKLNAHYDDGSESVVSPTYIVSPDMSTWGNPEYNRKLVAAIYTERGVTRSTVFDISVWLAKIEQLYVEHTGSKVFYTDEGLPDINEFTFSVLYNNGIVRDVSSSEIVIQQITPDTTVAGEHEITFALTEYYADVNETKTCLAKCYVDIIDPPVPLSIELLSEPKTFYWEGETLEDPGDALVYLSDGTTVEVTYTAQDIYGGPNTNVPGEYPCYILYERNGVTVRYDFTIQVSELKLVMLSVDLDKTKLVYDTDSDTFSVNDIYAIATFSDGHIQLVTPNVDAEPDLSIIGEQKVSISYDYITYSGEHNVQYTSYTIEVKSNKLASIEVNGPLDNTCLVGGEIDLTGLEIVATFEDGSVRYFNKDSEGVVIDSINTSASGRYSIGVSLTVGTVTKSSSFEIVVYILDHIEIDWEGSGAVEEDYTYLEYNLDLDLSGVAYYSDGTDVSLTKNISGAQIEIEITPNTLGHNTITASFTDGGITKHDTYGYEKKELTGEMSLDLSGMEESQFSFYQGQEFTMIGLRASLVYSNGERFDNVLWTELDVVGDNPTLQSGNVSVTVSYNYHGLITTATYEIYVKAVVGIEVDATNATTKYDSRVIEQEFNSNGARTYVVFNDGGREEISNSVTYTLVKVDDNNYKAETSYEVYGNTYTCSYDIYAITWSFSINYDFNNKDYYTGEYPDITNVTGTLTASDGSLSYDIPTSVSNEMLIEGDNIVVFTGTDTISGNTYNYYDSSLTVYARKLQAITIDEAKTTFKRGSNDYNLEQSIIATAHFTDGTSIQLNGNQLIFGGSIDTSTVGTRSFNIGCTFGDVTKYATYTYVVVEPQIVEFNVSGETTEFYQYENFTTEGITISIVYDNGMTEDIGISMCTVTMKVTEGGKTKQVTPNTETVGIYEITISYYHEYYDSETGQYVEDLNATYTYSIEVKEREVVSLTLDTSHNCPTTFYDGVPFRYTNLRVTANYNVGEPSLLSADEYTVEAPTFTDYGTYDVKVRSVHNPEVFATYTVEYKRPYVESVELVPYQDEFYEGDNFNYTQIASGTVIWNNGNETSITYDGDSLRYDPTTVVDMDTAGEYTIKYIYTDMYGDETACEYTITVLEANEVLVKLEPTQSPIIITQYEDNFSLRSVNFIAYYAKENNLETITRIEEVSGTNKEVTYSPSSINTHKLGTKIVTYTYKGVSCQVEFQIVEPETVAVGIELFNAPTTLDYTDSYDYDIESILSSIYIKIKMSDDSYDKQIIRFEDFDMSAYPDLNKKGTQTITITYQGFTCTWTFEVK